MDTQGRILLPAPLREYARLDKKVILVGQLKEFESWDATHGQVACAMCLATAQSEETKSDAVLSQVSL